MNIHQLSEELSVSPQIKIDDIGTIKALGFRSIIINRPDGEAPDQPDHDDVVAAAMLAGLEIVYLPVISGRILNANIDSFIAARAKMPRPTLAYCASGARSATLWALSEATRDNHLTLIAATKAAGYELSSLPSLLAARTDAIGVVQKSAVHHAVLVVGGGAAGLAVAASLRRRQNGLDIAIIEPRENHYYQPGFTLVGGKIYDSKDVAARTEKLIPKGVAWIHAGASSFEPERNIVVLENGDHISYETLIVACGLKIDLDAIPGLKETLGRNGVTTNYLIQYAPYTAKLADRLSAGVAIFTQPKAPFKCAGAPQKAMYLTCDRFQSRGVLSKIDVSFHTPTSALFGVEAYVPALQKVAREYGIDVRFKERLISVDGGKQIATFEQEAPDGSKTTVEQKFDMLHVVPPQCAPDIISTSPLAGADGWVDVDKASLQHVRYSNVFALGDVASTPNAKTAAAVRKQAPVVAENVLAAINKRPLAAAYGGYGSCPLIVSRGKALLAEFRYGGDLDPTFPNWLVDGIKTTRFAWWLKTIFMKDIYYRLMLKGREWLAKPAPLSLRDMAREQKPKSKADAPLSKAG